MALNEDVEENIKREQENEARKALLIELEKFLNETQIIEDLKKLRKFLKATKKASKKAS